ncbi:MAG: hypothetical protein HY255_02140 [Betaproteobacteria bacterium]|nr:hypothetical protein [Betaproteobacteria bacterium]
MIKTSANIRAARLHLQPPPPDHPARKNWSWVGEGGQPALDVGEPLMQLGHQLSVSIRGVLRTHAHESGDR